MAEITLKISGMSCNHCAMRVKKAIDSVAGVTSSQVEIGSAKVSYDDTNTGPDPIRDAVTKAGYTVIG